MSIKSIGLIQALCVGSAASYGFSEFDFLKSHFVIHSGVSDKPRGKRKNVSWRKSKGYKSRKARANNRKAMRR